MKPGRERICPSAKKWVFDQPFFLLLNLAVGGDWPGRPSAAPKFPATLLVDYVRPTNVDIPSGEACRFSWYCRREGCLCASALP